jgi:EmrB/QacA subfamily drug resistance transporter
MSSVSPTPSSPVNAPPARPRASHEHRAPAADAADSASAQHSAGRRASNFILATASGICALIVLDTNVVAVSLPSIARTFHASFADVEWVVSAYMVTFASCLLAAGGLADRIGRKRTLLIGLAVFALASLGCGLAPSVFWLNVARAVKGLGAAMEITSALAIIGHTFREEKERARAWALWGMCMGIATTVAPLVGGAITQYVGWRWIFLINLPICAVLAWCACRAMSESKNPEAAAIDKVGSVLFGLALASAIWTLIDAGTHGWMRAATFERAGFSALMFVVFVLAERRSRHAMVDLALFRDRRFVGAVLAMFGYAACAQVMMTFLPLYLQNAFGLPAVAAGLGMLPFAISMIVGPFIGAAMLRHYSIAWVLMAGLLMIGAGNVAVGSVAQSGSYLWVALGMIVCGCGAGIMNGNTQKAIVALVAPSRMGMASGISTTTRFTAIVMSVGVLGGVLSARTTGAFAGHVAARPAMADLIDSTFVSRVLAGDAAAAVAQAPESLHATLTMLARSSFASGFSVSMYVAGAVALVLSFCVWAFAARK